MDVYTRPPVHVKLYMSEMHLQYDSISNCCILHVLCMDVLFTDSDDLKVARERLSAKEEDITKTKGTLNATIIIHMYMCVYSYTL